MRTPKIRSKRKEIKQSTPERIVLWVGSLCGIIVSLFTVYDKLSEPSDPELNVTFFESSTTTLNISPSVNTAAEQTEEIPLQLRIENKGGKIAKNAKLYLSHYLNLSLTADYKKEEKRTWNSPNDAMKQLSLSLEDINPKESFLVPIKVKLSVTKDFQRTLIAPREDIIDKSLLEPIGYPLYCDLSSDTSPNRRSVLNIVIGRLDVLKEKPEDVFWIGHGENGVSVLKVKDDYPLK